MIKMLLNLVALLLVAAPPATSIAAAPAAPAVASPWGAGYFPNVPLVTHEGKTVRFYDDLLKGRKVLVNFVFNSCDQSCPLDTANMARLQKLLGDRLGKDIFMYSITLDPENDTPQVLKDYAEKFGAGPGWVFLTGQRADIDAVRFKFGDRGDKTEHANTVRVGDMETGRWMRLPLTGDPNYLAVEVNNVFYPGWSAGKSLISIADAPRPAVFGPGQVLFANRCSGCHAFGKGDQIGPDLKGVTQRRQRDWVARYLASPDKMRAAKDPIAIELAEKYKVLMPNLSLTTVELADLVDYLEAQGRTPATPDRTPAAAVAAAGDPPPVLAHDHHQHHHAGHKH